MVPISKYHADIRIRYYDAIYPGFAAEPLHRTSLVDSSHVVFNRIAREHHLAKPTFVYRKQVDRAPPLCISCRKDYNHACGLRDALDHHHTRIDRLFREMLLKLHFVESNLLDPSAAEIALDIDKSVVTGHFNTIYLVRN